MAEEPESSPATPSVRGAKRRDDPPESSDVVSNPGHSSSLDTGVRGDKEGMQFLQLIRRRIRHQAGGVDLVGDVNAAVAANVGERSTVSHVSTHSEAKADHGKAHGKRRTSA